MLLALQMGNAPLTLRELVEILEPNFDTSPARIPLSRGKMA